MKIAPVIALLILALTTSAHNAVSRIQKYTHVIQESVITGSDLCSSEAIGKHAILTASHCELPTDKVSIDGNDETKIYGVIRDGNDHSIYLVGDEFKDVAEFGKTPEVGDDVEMSGNPHGMPNVYRKGYVVKIKEAQTANALAEMFGIESSPEIIYYDMNVFEGDSGAGVFIDGRLVGVMSFELPAPDGDTGKLSGSFGLTFTQAQLDEAKNFVPPAEKK